MLRESCPVYKLLLDPESILCFLTKRKNEGASKSKKSHDVYVKENAEKGESYDKQPVRLGLYDHK